MKEIWYVWDGNGSHPSRVKSIMFRNGEIAKVNSFDWRNGYGPYIIIAYTLGETRVRVRCSECKDSRFKGLVYCGGYFEYRECSECNGAGYTWKYGVSP